MNNKLIWNAIYGEVNIKPQLELIAECLINSNNKKYSLMGGNSGIAIFLYYYWSFTKNDEYLEKANHLILNSFNMLKRIDSLSSGSAGFMWAINHLINNNFIEGQCDELFSDKDHALFLSMMNDIQEGKFDFLHNALGMGLYFLNKSNEHFLQYNEPIVVELEKIATRDTNDLKWKSLLLPEKAEVYNLSLSHGISSIIVYLSKAYQKDILKEKTKELLDGAITFLLTNKSAKPNPLNGAYFPAYIYVNQENITVGSRLAWCYGDLGIGIAIWQASQALQNNEWREIAIDILLQTTLRKDTNKEGVKDAGFCHGTAGIAHIYNRIYHYTKDIRFKDAAVYWLGETLDKAKFEDGFAGFKAWYPDQGMVNQEGLLEGIAGIGLVLLAGISTIEPKWDECFLLS
jgi:lantibiotic biosynthesis protein